MPGFHYDNRTGRISHDAVPREALVIVDPAGSNLRNVFTTLAEAVAAIAAMSGPRTLLLSSGSYTWPTGVQDLSGVTVQGVAGVSLTVPEGTTWSRMPSALLGLSSLRFSNTANPIYSGDGEDIDIDIQAQTVYCTGTAIPIVINNPGPGATYGYIRCRGNTLIKSDGVEPSVIRMELDARLDITLYDASELHGSTWPIENDGGGGTRLTLNRYGSNTEYDPPDLSVSANEHPTPPAGGRLGVIGELNDSGLAILADNTYGSDSLFSPRYGHIPSPHPAWSIAQWVHPTLLDFMAVQSGRIFPVPVAGVIPVIGAPVLTSFASDGFLSGVTIDQGVVGPPDTRPYAQMTAITYALEGLQEAVGAPETGWSTNIPIGCRWNYMKTMIWFSFFPFGDTRLFVGLSDQVGSDAIRAINTASDDPNANMIGLQYSEPRGDSRFQFMVKRPGGVQQLVQNNVVAVDFTKSYVLEIDTWADDPATNRVCITMKLYVVDGTGFNVAGQWSWWDNDPNIVTEQTMLGVVASCSSGFWPYMATMGAVARIAPIPP